MNERRRLGVIAHAFAAGTLFMAGCGDQVIRKQPIPTKTPEPIQPCKKVDVLWGGVGSIGTLTVVNNDLGSPELLIDGKLENGPVVFKRLKEGEELSLSIYGDISVKGLANNGIELQVNCLNK